MPKGSNRKPHKGNEASSCGLCTKEDTEEMVQCDVCNAWYHFSCAKVGSDIRNKDWVCEGCVAKQAEDIDDAEDQEANQTICQQTAPARKVCTLKVNENSSGGPSNSRRAVGLELMRLEEERKAELSYLKKKFELLAMQDDCEGIEMNEGVANDGGLGKGLGEGVEVKKAHSGKQGEQNQNINAAVSIGSLYVPSQENLNARQVVSRELPIFSGKPEEWPLFFSSFETSTRICGLSNDENLLRLQRSLKGKAFEYVSHSLTLPALVPEIMSTLRMAFGRPEHIINNLLAKIRSTAPVNPNRLDSLINFSLEVKGIVATMEASGLVTYLNSPLLLQDIIEKLPVQKRIDWAMYSENINEVNLKTLSDWLFKFAEAASRVISTPITGSLDSERRKVHRLNFHETSSTPSQGNSSSSFRCYACDGPHGIINCEQFSMMSYNDKWSVVNTNKLCRSCLRRHDAKFCRNRRECQVDGCHAKHHPLLHKTNTTVTRGCTDYAGVVAIHNMQTSKVLYRIVPITIFGKNTSIDVYAFLDDGSGPTLIEKDVLSQIGSQGITSDLCLRWTDGTVRIETNSHHLDLQIAPKGKNNNRYSLRNVRSVDKLDLPSQTLKMLELTEEYKHLKGLPVESYQNVVPKVLIGLNNRSLAMPLNHREGKMHEPAATKTRLGWTIYGELSGSPNTHSTAKGFVNMHLHICECDDDVALQKLMIDNMKIENEGLELVSRDSMNLDTNNMLKNCIKREGDRFISKLLWKSENMTLPNNEAMAYRRLCCFEKRLEKDPDLKQQVNIYIQNMETKDYIRKLQRNELNIDYPRKWHLPIFAVRNPNKPQKIRVVWDAAAECNGVSLNGCIEKGPDLMTSLTDVLFNFRIGKVGICGDICEMFHRIAVDENDQQSQRFLWRGGENHRRPDTFILKVMSFGASCSPSIAQSVKNSNALEYSQQFPRAAKSIIERHYVDDMLDSVNSVKEAIDLAKEVREIHKHANFHIRNWISNSTEVIDALGEAGTAYNFCQAGKTVEQVMEVEKVLGMWWQTNNDTFTFNLKFTKASEEVLRGGKLPTKRQLLRLLMSIFDPLGILNFFTVYMKTLLQDIWRSGIGWDDTIPQEFSNAWNRWLSQLQRIEMVEFPRCYFNLASSDSSKVQLHVFVDASETAYAAVAYFRIATENGTEVVLVCSKTKVAPLRPISIPRMELLAAVLGSRLGNGVAKAHELKIESTHYWSDSKTVLLWLRADPKAYKQFVMFRVGEIQESTDVTNWKYVPSKQNIADLATKWSQQPDFNPNSPWFTGPTFLNQSPDLWPSNQLPLAKDSDAELRQNNEIKQQLAVQICEEDPIVNYRRFSKWERLFSCMAYVNRFINLVSRKRLTGTSIKQTRINPNLDEVPCLTKTELLWGQQILYRLAQSQTFSLEYRLLSDNPHFILPKSSSLRSMSPFIDEDMTIRMRGRLEKMTLVSNTSKNPIIMPKTHYITALIVDWYHRKFKHANHETVINEIFQTYHISGLRTLFRTIRSQCQTCKVQRARPSPPEMGSLPAARLSPYTRPFSYVGVDFFGPFLVTVGRRTEKRYGVVFTCLTCRAIHVEVAHSLTMNSCVIVIRNFIARRGYPIQFFSDNGTNLKAAEKELREAYDQINFSGIQTEFTTTHTTWEFIPPGSPHMGGAWERMVRSIKTTLYQIISPDTKMTDEKLNNLLVEVESIVNSRPLTYLSLDTAEQEALTPNHFLLGSSSGNKPPGVFEETDKYVRSSWRHSQLLADKFWKRWVAEFLPTLTRRTNWFDKTKPIEEGDVVIIIDPSLPRHCWPKGVVVKAVSAKDGQVRSAIVRTATGEYHRPAAKIAVLDVRREVKGAGVAEQVFTHSDRHTGGGMLPTPV